MRIITNYAISLNKASYKQNNAKQSVSDVKFEGEKSRLNKNNLIYVPMMLALVSVGGCNQAPKMNAEVTPSIEYKSDSVKNSIKKTSRDYDDVINKFLGQKEINRIEVFEASDPNYKDVFRTIYAEGYDIRGRIIREVVIHPQEPSISSKEPIYCPEPEVKLVEYMPDRVVTKEYDNGKYMATSTKYYKETELNGVSGYKKEIIVSSDGSKEFIYKNAEYELLDGVPRSDNKKYHERHIYYNSDNARTGHVDFRPDERGNIVIYESTSDIPEDF